MEIRLCGRLQVLVDGQPRHERLSRKAGWLLGLLVLRHGRPLERSWIAGTLWPDTPESRALYNLRRELHSLRASLGDEGARIRTPTPTSLALDVEGAKIDVLELDRAIASDDEVALATAVAACEGPLLDGCDEPWAVAARGARAEQYPRALELLAERAARRDPALAIAYLRRAITLDPLRESGHRRLMQTLAAMGERAAATRTYHDLCELLDRELGVAPSAVTRATFEQLVDSEHHTSEVRSPGAPVGRIPVPLDELVGREAERVQVADQLREARLLTLVGTGGIGKSRLAIAVAGDVAQRFAAGVWFVELAGISDPGLVPDVVAHLLGIKIPPHVSPSDALVEHVSAKQLLLVLDNCEHVLERCAQLVDRLLRACGRLRVLATSRQSLGLHGEVLYRVPSLPVPAALDDPDPARSPAVRLFVERARAVQAALSPSPAELAVVGAICRRLDGIPLAIELAAGRALALTISQIAERLDDRFALIAPERSDDLPRHRTLHATMDWSHDLLGRDEAMLFRRLAVFAGSFDLAAVAAVCPVHEHLDVARTLERLVDRSLVVFPCTHGAGRYRLLETVRAYARHQLEAAGELLDARNRHLCYFVAFAEAREPSIFGGMSDPGEIARLTLEEDNLRAAFAHAAAIDDPEPGLRLVAALHWFWFARGRYREGCAHAEATLARAARAREDVVARASAAAGYMAFWCGDYEGMRRLTEHALAGLDPETDPRGELQAACGYGAALLLCGDPQLARDRLRRAVARARELDEPPMLVFATYWFGMANFMGGDLEAAARAFSDCLSLARATDNGPAIGHALVGMGHVAHLQGDDDESWRAYHEGLRALRAIDDRWGIQLVLEALVPSLVSRGELRLAACLWGAVNKLRRDTGAVVFREFRDRAEQAALAAREGLDALQYANEVAAGEALSLDDAISLALGAPSVPAAP